MRTHPTTKILITCIFMSILSANTWAESLSEMDWDVTPYLWGSSIETDIQVGGASIAGTNVEFKDLVDKLEIGFMLHVEGEGERYGLFVDISYIELGDTDTQKGVRTETDIDQGMYELAATFKPGNPDSPFDMFAGVRFVTLDAELGLTTPAGAVSQTFSKDINRTDILVGFRYFNTLADSWQVKLRLDGGVETGGNDVSVNAVGLLGYTFGESFDGTAFVGYRHFVLQVDEGNLEIDLSYSGPLAGFKFAV
jgi:hypothetical protein